MRKLRTALASLLAAAVVVAPAVYFFVERANETASEADLTRLQGQWDLQTISADDRWAFVIASRFDSVTFVVKGNRIEETSFRLSTGCFRKGECVLDVTREPKHLDLRFEYDGSHVINEKALYRLERGTLSLCRNRKDPAQRPEEFRADQETGIVIEVYERKSGWRSF